MRNLQCHHAKSDYKWSMLTEVTLTYREEPKMVYVQDHNIFRSVFEKKITTESAAVTTVRKKRQIYEHDGISSSRACLGFLSASVGQFNKVRTVKESLEHIWAFNPSVNPYQPCRRSCRWFLNPSRHLERSLIKTERLPAASTLQHTAGMRFPNVNAGGFVDCKV